ncbi:PIN domain-containing protein [Sporolactobacillus pectinivorans]|uniref:PIN domain-containing protein n=1 Tax=Sporolactobacillus pectinivorans TaxID=1591408 RepID=UPI0012FE79C2|nr:PIN domain-containing protein [Sporolactobacillus pectinivorans]
MKNEQVLIDTNILIYAWDHQNLEKQQKAIETLNRFRRQLLISMQSLSEFTAVMLKHGCDPERLLRIIERMERLMNILPLKKSDVLYALQGVQRYQMPYWDAQIWAAARSNDIPLLFAEDGPVGETIEGVTYVNPLG